MKKVKSFIEQIFVEDTKQSEMVPLLTPIRKGDPQL